MDLRALPPEWLLAFAGAALLLALVQTLRLFWQRFARRSRLQRWREQGAAGEVRAEALLRKLGYTILGRQVAVTYALWIDGAPSSVDLRGDFLVSLDERRYLAEVKTGRLAPRIDTAATRRQLLEYRLAFEVDGILLVDADTERVRSVEFPLPAITPAAAAPPGARLAWLLAGAAAGILAMVAARSSGW